MDDLLAQIKQALPIEEALARYIPELQVRRRGDSGYGLCPFHAERHPSFYIRFDRNRWNCYGCGKFGDTVDLIACTLNVSIRDAVRFLAKDLGILGAGTDDRTMLAKKMREAKARQVATRNLREELNQVFKGLCLLERELDRGFREYGDYDRNYDLLKYRDKAAWLLDEFLTHEDERKIAVWRYVRKEMPWLIS